MFLISIIHSGATKWLIDNAPEIIAPIICMIATALTIQIVWRIMKRSLRAILFDHSTDLEEPDSLNEPEE